MSRCCKWSVRNAQCANRLILIKSKTPTCHSWDCFLAAYLCCALCIAHCIFHVTSKPCGLRLVFVRQLTGPSVWISMAYSRFSSRKRDGQPTRNSASLMLLGPELWSCGWERGGRKNSETCQYSPASVSSGQSSNQVIITVGWWNGPPVFS